MTEWQTDVSDGVAVIVCPARVSMAVKARCPARADHYPGLG